jgi:hypothetical protein
MHISETTRKKLKSYPNVTGVGYGFKVSQGQLIRQRSIVVYVSKKLPLSSLSDEDIIPTSIDNLPTDVRVLKVKALAEDPNTYRPAPGGCSVGHYQITAGTLGTWVEYLGKVCILSNNHVLANSNEGAIGDRILQPGPYDKGQLTIAYLTEFKEIFLDDSGGNPTDCEFSQLLEFLMNFLSGLLNRKTRVKFYKLASPNYVDAAVAERIENNVSKLEVLEIGKISPITLTPTLGATVRKRGRTTRLTNGFISAIEVEVQVSGYGNGNQTATFQDQVIVETNDNLEFSAGGDSGSLVVGEQNRPVGLLFAGGEDDSGRKITVINNINRVVEAFPDIRFL